MKIEDIKVGQVVGHKETNEIFIIIEVDRASQMTVYVVEGKEEKWFANFQCWEEDHLYIINRNQPTENKTCTHNWKSSRDSKFKEWCSICDARR